MESPRTIICSIYGTMESPHQTFSPPYSWRIESELRPQQDLIIILSSLFYYLGVRGHLRAVRGVRHRCSLLPARGALPAHARHQVCGERKKFIGMNRSSRPKTIHKDSFKLT